jgi:hypothetical protein
MQFKTWKDMFEFLEGYNGLRIFIKHDEIGLEIPVDELYQHFKNRMLDEVVAKDNGLARTIEYRLEDKEI